MTGITGCWGCATSGHVAATPPKTVMSSRRITAECLQCLRPEGYHNRCGRRSLRCGISIRPMFDWDHLLTKSLALPSLNLWPPPPSSTDVSTSEVAGKKCANFCREQTQQKACTEAHLSRRC